MTNRFRVRDVVRSPKGKYEVTAVSTDSYMLIPCGWFRRYRRGTWYPIRLVRRKPKVNAE